MVNRDIKRTTRIIAIIIKMIMMTTIMTITTMKTGIL